MRSFRSEREPKLSLSFCADERPGWLGHGVVYGLGFETSPEVVTGWE